MMLNRRQIDFSSGSTAEGGEEAEFGEIYGATVRSVQMTQEALSRRNALEEAYDNRIDDIFRATGQRGVNPFRAGIGGPGDVLPGVGGGTDPFQDYQSWAAKLAEAHPGKQHLIRADVPVEREAEELARDAERQEYAVWSRAGSGPGKYLAYGVGSLRAAATDPVNLATLPLGPIGRVGVGAKAVLWQGLKTGAANAAVETGAQPFVQDWRRDAGLDYGLSQAAMNIAAAGALGFLADTGIRSGYRGVQRLRGREAVLDAEGGVTGYRPKSSEDALEQAARAAPEGSVLRRAASGDPDALREAARATGADQSPEMRGALQALDRDGDLAAPDVIAPEEHAYRLPAAERAAAEVSNLPPGDALPHGRAEGAQITRAVDAPEERIVEVYAKDPIEFAAEIRANPKLLEEGLPWGDAKLRGAALLSRLSEDAFDAVAAGDVAPRIGAAIAEHVADTSRHFDLAQKVAAKRPKTKAEIEGHLSELLQEGQRAAGSRQREDVAPSRIDDPAGPEAKADLERLRAEHADEIETATGERPAAGSRQPASGEGEPKSPATPKPGEGARAQEAFEAEVDAVWANVEGLRAVDKLPRPERLTNWVIRKGGIWDEGGDLRNIAGGVKGRPGLVRGKAGDRRQSGQGGLAGIGGGDSRPKGSMTLDDATFKAWEEGFLPGDNRPEINDLLDAIREDAGGRPVVRQSDAEILRDLDDLEEIENGLDKLGVLKAANRDEVRALLREREGVYQNSARSGEEGVAAALRGADASAETPEVVSRKIDQAIEDVKRRLPLGVTVKSFADLAELPERFGAALKKAGAEGAVDGVTERGTGHIWLARQALDPESTLDHETVHALRETGVLTDAELTILAKKADTVPGLWDRGAYERAYAGMRDRDEALRQEAAAHLYAARRGGASFGKSANAILDGIAAFFERLKNKLGGLGFQSADDVMRAIESGEMGARSRAVKLGGGADGLFALRSFKRETDYIGRTNAEILVDGRVVGGAYVRQFADTIQITSFKIDEAFQRQGLGTEFQEYIEGELGKPAVPDGMLSEKEYQRWLKVDPEAVRDYQKGTNNYTPKMGSDGQYAALGGAPVPGSRADKIRQPAAGSRQSGGEGLFSLRDADQPETMAPRVVSARELGFAEDVAGASGRYSELIAEERRLRQSIPQELRGVLADHRWSADAAQRTLEFDRDTLGKPDHLLRQLSSDTVAVTLKRIRALGKEITQVERAADQEYLVDRLVEAAKSERPPDQGSVVYHGTDDESFAKYDPEVARSKSEAARDAKIDVAWVTPIRRFAERFGAVRTLHLAPGYYFDPNNPVDLARLAPFINRRSNAARVWKRLDAGDQNSWGLLEGADTLQELQRLGYDGVRMSENFYDKNDVQRSAGTLAVFTKGKLQSEGRGEAFFSLRDADPAASLREEARAQLKADLEAAKAETDAKKAATLERRALLDEGIRRNNERFATTFKDVRGQHDPVKFLSHLIETHGEVELPAGMRSVAGEAKAVENLFKAENEEVMHTFRPQFGTGKTRQMARLTNVVRELHGEGTGDEAAASMAMVMGRSFETIRQEFNAAGGDIRKLEGWAGPQNHDRAAMLAAGPEKWLNDEWQWLDIDRIIKNNADFETGQPLTRARLKEILREIYEDRTSDGAGTQRDNASNPFGGVSGDKVGRKMLANQHAEHRFLHYKNADAALAHEKAYGGGADPLGAWMAYISRMSKDIAALRLLGSNPDRELARLANFAMKQAKLVRSARVIVDEAVSKVKALQTDLLEAPDRLNEIADREGRILKDLEAIRRKRMGQASERNRRKIGVLQDDLMKLHVERRGILAASPAVRVPGVEGAKIQEALTGALDELMAVQDADRVLFPKVAEITGRQMDRGGFGTVNPEDYARQWITTAETMWGHFRGAVNIPVNEKGARHMQTLRNVAVVTRGGSMVISSMADNFAQILARDFIGTPKHKVMTDVLKQFTRKNTREAARAGLIAESYLHMFNDGARNAATYHGAEWSNVLAERTIALQGLAKLTDAQRHGFGMSTYAMFADLAKETWEGVGKIEPKLQRLLRRYGIDAKAWDAIRLDAAGKPHDVDFLTGPLIKDTLEAQGRGAERIAERYLAMILQETDFASPVAMLRSRAVMTGKTRPGTLLGEIVRTGGQFKSFSVMFWMTHGERAMREFIASGSWPRGSVYAAEVLGVMAMAGALVAQLKALKRGEDPEPMNTPKFWGRAMLQGGGLGIWGDLLASQTNRFGGGMAGTFGGPVLGLAEGVFRPPLRNATAYLNGEKTHFGRDVSKTLSGLVPGTSLWYVNLFWQRHAADALQRQLDPEAEAAFRDRQQRHFRDYGNRYWWGAGQRSPRAPDFGSALGAR